MNTGPLVIQTEWFCISSFKKDKKVRLLGWTKSQCTQSARTGHPRHRKVLWACKVWGSVAPTPFSVLSLLWPIHLLLSRVPKEPGEQLDFQCVSKPRWQEDVRARQGPLTWNVLFQAASFLWAKAQSTRQFVRQLGPKFRKALTRPKSNMHHQQSLCITKVAPTVCSYSLHFLTIICVDIGK